MGDMVAPTSESELDLIIQPEIKNDEFYALIENLARTENLRYVLEIGSSAGGGSTEAFVKGLRDNPHHPHLFCIEVSRPRFKVLAETYAAYEFVYCYNLSSVSVEEFPTPDMVAEFYVNAGSGLNRYPLPQVLGWLQQDIRYVREAAAGAGAIERIRADHGIKRFDMVLIDGSEFTGLVEFEKIKGASIILLDDTNTHKCFEVRRRLLADPEYELIADNQELRNGFSAFRRRSTQKSLPIHFFTIVLNGEPFIRYHERAFEELSIDWHWHIVEGVAALKHDTAWSVAAGGRVLDSVHDQGRSVDGTSAYLDDLAARYPDRVTIYRKPPGAFWDGKREMVNAPLPSINEPCLLWQIDADELWTAEQIRTVHEKFTADPKRTAAFYWCDYFVGPKLILGTRYNYAENPRQEWLRTWRFEPGMTWKAHEPPILVDAVGRDVAGTAFTHDEMEEAGVVFQHFAYATEEQLRFKESYYGYAGALERWRRLQDEARRPVLLRDYLPWVTDETLVDSAEARGVMPLAVPDEDGWRFLRPVEIGAARRERPRAGFKILVDGIFFQHLNSGIARVWIAVLKSWVETGFAENVLLLDRAGTAPRLPGVHTRTIPAHDYARSGADSLLLQRVCDEEGADLFISTYYSTPTTTPSLFMGYDMIPEALGFDLSDEAWHEKHRAIQHAVAHVMISQNSARDLERMFPIPAGSTTVAYCGVDAAFRPASENETADFKKRHGIDRPYLLMVGERAGFRGYKNGLLLFHALGMMEGIADEIMVVCVGGRPEIEPTFAALAPSIRVTRLSLSDADLRLAYAGAQALVYPSRYEGFGMPVVEAMACGCPVITCANSSLPEVAGNAALFVGEDDPEGMVACLRRVNDPVQRRELIAPGLEQARRFTFRSMADTLAATIETTVGRLRDGSLRGPGPLWCEFREFSERIRGLSTEVAAAAVFRARFADTERAMAEARREDEARFAKREAELLATLEQSRSETERAREEAESVRNSPFWRLRGVILAILRPLGLRRR